ncbi:flagellar biosynthesis protein FlhF [Cupriavidus basilensis]|uniref:flagellar biosynthesis protein FlhF n=1 Tax=Cupriavidus basilensis TaxID=68895 RepID=UPI00075110D7|nr:flagellar biosynthesis protein FlhF [Cupriavidus basilensis]
MSVAKFVAANGREALRQVREAMGPDAVVLSNRTVEGGVEIVAMRDTDLGAISSNAPVFTPPPATVAVDGALGDLRGELQNMRAMMERQFAGQAAAVGTHSLPATGGDPLRDSLFNWLVTAGFSGQLARTLLGHLPLGHDRPAAMTWIRQELARKVPVLGDEDALFAQGGVLALVGPTGVGKTTTTAKLAARFVLKHGPERLALLTTDTFRIGAHEQLRIYGDILGVPVHAVKDASDLRFALAALSEKHLVIIDTVGMSQRDRSLSEQIAMLGGVQAPVQRILLLNGASHGDTLNEVVHAYRHDTSPDGGIDGCIVSKLDEATHLGSVLDVVIRHRLPVYYASTGQRVPEHLELASGTALVERAFQTPRRGSVFAEAEAARRALPARGEGAAATGADGMLRSLTDSANAVSDCVDQLDGGNYGFDLVRTLWQQRADSAPSARLMAQHVRESVCRDLVRQCDRFVLALSAVVAAPAAGRRAARPWLHTLWLADRDGLPLAAAVAPGGRIAPVLQATQGGWETDAVNLAATIAATRTVVNVLDAMPAPAMLARWQTAGERWLTATRRTTRVVSGGAALKVDALADTLTFHAVEEMEYRGRAAAQWVAQAPVRVLESQARGARGAEGGIEAGLLVSRVVDLDNGQTLAVQYLLCDPALLGEGAQLARWARWAEDGEAQLRTLGHALDHLSQGERQDGAGDAAQAEGQACARLLALQMAIASLRLEQAGDTEAAAFLARLSARAPARQTPNAAVLVEGMGRLLALLDVLENYPARNGRAAVRDAAPAVSAAVSATVSTAASTAISTVASATEADAFTDSSRMFKALAQVQGE